MYRFPQPVSPESAHQHTFQFHIGRELDDEHRIRRVVRVGDGVSEVTEKRNPATEMSGGHPDDLGRFRPSRAIE
ncbi:hypothetical protein GCM10027598_47760 [Amycolatopsis oliviviridis]|uniref:Uncharacterized protein n=1 Tax=Amycolatopsis oliviviridis TaxID=1471590 RepID=A0ABQ3MD86_9PSEU|nr:hypothetical protein GCM10017790_82610 [Amycolatopsis oliviviridis]